MPVSDCCDEGRADEAVTLQWSGIMLQLKNGSGSDTFFALTGVMEV